MSRKLPLGSFVVLLSLLISNPLLSQPSPTAPAFYLRDGMRVLFYGDSITAQREYTEDVEEYVLTRFPEWKVTFINAGISGDRVTGGSTAGPIDLRLSRDVFPMKPDVITIMLGMNDGYYRAPESGIESVYRAGYRHIVESIEQSLPLARLTLVKPSPYDDITRAPAPQGGYNQVLLGYGKFLESFGAEKGIVIADFNEPVTTVLNRIARSSPVLARQLIPDRVHPQRAAHWLMAESLLKVWNAPALVSEVTIDVSKKNPSSQGKNTSITDLHYKAGELEWAQLDQALPLPLPSTDLDPVFGLVVGSSDLVGALDTQQLQVRGLRQGKYVLLIDSQQIGTFENGQLEAGINLATLDTPMLEQAKLVAYDTERKNSLEEAEFRIRQVSTDEDNLNTAHALADALPVAETRQRLDAYPRTHHFVVRPVGKND